jgi:hypothetical protein
MPRPAQIVNVVATLPGTDPQSRDRLIVVSGHYDSRASDVMAPQRFDAPLGFLAVAGEEQGPLGATHCNTEADLAGYRIVWHDADSPVWQHRRDVGLVTRATLEGVSKDNSVFGVQAMDRDGQASRPAAARAHLAASFTSASRDFV